MGNKKAIFAVGTTALTALGTFVACGSDKAKPDAPVQHDAPIDSKPIDAAPDASPYDFTCYGGSGATTAADPVKIGGTTESFGMSGATPVGSAGVEIYKIGTAAPVDSLQSGSDGTFTSADITTGGVPLDGFIRASHDTFRISYMYPPNPIAATVAGVPVPMISEALFGMLSLLGIQQNDTNNGVLLATVTDCANMPINGATLKVQQSGSDVGDQHDLGQVNSAAAGIIIVANVPDGATEVSATFGSMTFPTHTVVAHKHEALGSGAGSGSNALVGTLTLTTVRPGP